MTKLNSSHNKISHTLMISGIPKEYCRTPDELRTHFDEAFNDVKIIDIKLVYDVRKLMTVYNLLKKAKTALNYCRQKKKGSIQEQIVLKLQFHSIPSSQIPEGGMHYIKCNF